MGSTTFAGLLADWLGSEAFAARAQATLRHAGDVVLDTVAAVAAFDEDDTFPAYTALLAGEGASGSATLFGTGAHVAPLVAASVNGAQANATLLAEGHRQAGGHPAAHIVPAVIAAAESAHSSGRRTLTAVIVGYEAAVRVREFVGPVSKGLSPNGNWGTIGAAAAVAWLLTDEDPQALRSTLDTAAALAPAAPMSFGHEGAEAYRHFVGVGAGLGLSIGVGAAQGWAAPGGVIENEYAIRSTGRPASISALRAGFFDRPPAITENYFKRHAVCAHLSAAGDAAAELHDQGLDPSDVASIAVSCGIAATCEMDDPKPGNRFAARYSLPVVSAAGLVHGAEVLSRFPASILEDDLVMSIAARTTTSHDPELVERYPNGRPTKVLVHLEDGSQRQVTAGVPLGDAANPLDHDKLRDKIRGVLARTRGERVAEAVLAAGGALHSDSSIDVLTAALEK